MNWTSNIIVLLPIIINPSWCIDGCWLTLAYKEEEAIFIAKVDLQKFEDNNTKVNATTLIWIQWEKFKFLVGVVGHQHWGFHPETVSPKGTLVGWNSWRGISPYCLQWHGSLNKFSEAWNLADPVPKLRTINLWFFNLRFKRNFSFAFLAKCPLKNLVLVLFNSIELAPCEFSIWLCSSLFAYQCRGDTLHIQGQDDAASQTSL